jgi:hypothetical protein
MILCINAQGRFLRGLGPRLQMKLMVIPVGRSLVFSGSQVTNISYSTDHRQKIFRTDPAPAPIASKEPEKGQHQAGVQYPMSKRRSRRGHIHSPGLGASEALYHYRKIDNAMNTGAGGENNLFSGCGSPRSSHARPWVRIRGRLIAD